MSETTKNFSMIFVLFHLLKYALYRCANNSILTIGYLFMCRISLLMIIIIFSY